jgi:hypothetical protein
VHLVPATDDPRFVPSVALTAAAPERSRVEARAFATGGTPPYTYLWAGSNPEIVGATVIFGNDNVEPLLGVTPLESVGIEVDPKSQRLKRLPAVRLKSRSLPTQIHHPLG